MSTKLYLTGGQFFEIDLTPSNVAKALGTPPSKLVDLPSRGGGTVTINPTAVTAFHLMPGQPPEGPTAK